MEVAVRTVDNRQDFVTQVVELDPEYVLAVTVPLWELVV